MLTRNFSSSIKRILAFKAETDYENPRDQDQDNTYNIALQVIDQSGDVIQNHPLKIMVSNRSGRNGIEIISEFISRLDYSWERLKIPEGTTDIAKFVYSDSEFVRVDIESNYADFFSYSPEEKRLSFKEPISYEFVHFERNSYDNKLNLELVFYTENNAKTTLGFSLDVSNVEREIYLGVRE